MKTLKNILLHTSMAGAVASVFFVSSFNSAPAYEIFKMDLDYDGKADLYWFDKNEDKVPQDNEIYIDLDEDGKPDINYQELKEFYKNKEEREENNAVQI